MLFALFLLCFVYLPFLSYPFLLCFVLTLFFVLSGWFLLPVELHFIFSQSKFFPSLSYAIPLYHTCLLFVELFFAYVVIFFGLCGPFLSVLFFCVHFFFACVVLFGLSRAFHVYVVLSYCSLSYLFCPSLSYLFPLLRTFFFALCHNFFVPASSPGTVIARKTGRTGRRRNDAKPEGCNASVPQLHLQRLRTRRDA